MFDIGFLEMLLVLIIALLVIGPERMPEVARKIGQFVGKMRRFINSVKEEGQVQETIRDFQQSMNLEAEKKNFENIHKDLQSGLNFGEGLKLEEFQRPFGGAIAPQETEEPPASQFNRAPDAPKLNQTASQGASQSTSQTAPALPSAALNSQAEPIIDSAKATQDANKSDGQTTDSKPLVAPSATETVKS
jgi:sec-independent protein translocase protein TatB